MRVNGTKSGNSTRKSQAPRPPGISYPWIVVLLGVLLLMSFNIYNYTFGVFFKPIAEEFGWSRAAMSGAFAIRSLLGAALVVPMGYWADRYGPRRVLLPCFILLGVSMMAAARVSTIWQLYLVLGVCMGIGSSGPFVSVVSTVAKWHDRRRGLALGMASAGTGLSSIIFPPVATQLIAALDWQFAIFVMGVIILAIGIPASLIIRDPPAGVKQQPATSEATARRGHFEVWRLLPRYLKNTLFLAIILMFVLVSAAGNMLLNHLVNYATDIGITALVAAGMMSALGVASTTGRLGMGAISDRIGTKADAAVCCALLAVSFLLLTSKVTALMWIAAVLLGIGFGGSIPLAPAIMGERVAIEQLSAATGVASMGLLTGAALGPWLGGFIFDVSSSYLWALVLAAGASVVALIIALRLPTPKH